MERLNLDTLRDRLSTLTPAQLLGTQFVLGERPEFEMADGRKIHVVKSGWGEVARSTGPWGDALSGFAATHIEFYIAVPGLGWSARAYYTDGVLVAIRADVSQKYDFTPNPIIPEGWDVDGYDKSMYWWRR